MTEQTAKSIDYSVMAKTALEWLTRFEETRATLERQEPMCREKWRDYGQALLDQRLVMKSDNEFGAWVRANGLDTGAAKDQPVRSSAMWLAREWDGIKALIPAITRNHPVDIRTEARKAGYVDQFEARKADQSEPHAKLKPKRKQAKEIARKVIELAKGTAVKKAPHSAVTQPQVAERKMPWLAAAERCITGGLPVGFPRDRLYRTGERGGLRRTVEQHLGHSLPVKSGSIECNSSEARAIANALMATWVQINPERAIAEASEASQQAREQVKETDRAKFDRLLKQATDAELKKLQAMYHVSVDKGIEERAKALEALERKVKDEWETVSRIRSAIACDYGMSADEYKLIVGCLHPDRQPEEQRARFAKAFEIFRRCVVLGGDQRTLGVKPPVQR